MICKQVKFKDYDSDDTWIGGIGIYEGDDESEELQCVICGCCGGIIELEDIKEIEPYRDWMNIEAEIRGDD